MYSMNREIIIRPRKTRKARKTFKEIPNYAGSQAPAWEPAHVIQHIFRVFRAFRGQSITLPCRPDVSEQLRHRLFRMQATLQQHGSQPSGKFGDGFAPV